MDPPSHNAAMVEKLDLPFPLLSDPKGDLTRSLDLWNEDESVCEPAVLIVDRAGRVRYRYSGGSDFSDRPAEDDLPRILDGIETEDEPGDEVPAISVSAAEAEEETVRPDKPAMTLDALRPYYLGAHFTGVALQKKLEDDESKERVAGYQKLVDEYNGAIEETVKEDS